MTALTDFLLARLAEDEVRAREWRDDPGYECLECHGHSAPWVPETLDYERVLVECEAKRAVVNALGFYLEFERNTPAGEEAALVALGALASVHADHPDYRQEWKP